MQNVFNLPRRLLLALAVVLIALTVFSTHQLMYARTTGAFGAVVLSCAGLLALLVVAGLGHAVDVLKPLLEARVGNAAASMPSPLSHRQNLEQCVAREVIHSAMSWSGDGARAGKMARNALDALTGTAAPAPLQPFAPTPSLSSDIEALIQAKGKTAPCITPADIAANIADERYFTAEVGVPAKDGSLSLLTFCVLVLRNGFTVTGESACASPENFDPEIGRKIARESAVQKIWPLMGYELRTKLAA